MGAATIWAERNAVTLRSSTALRRLNDRDFFELCQANPDLRLERTSDGDLVIMSPTGGTAGRRNFTLIHLFAAWAEADGSGLSFDSSTGFTLPSGAVRTPDLSWVRRERWDALSQEERDGFVPLCPDFVVELRSGSDSLSALQQKMHEYVDNGVQLGWLIDPFERRVHVYRPGGQADVLEDPVTLSGGGVLAGLVLDVQRLW